MSARRRTRRRVPPRKRTPGRDLLGALPVKIGKRIQELREQQGLSRQELAGKAGIHPVHLRNIEQGNHNFRISTLISIARAFGMTASGLFKGVG